MNEPLVSILMPARNAEEYIAEAIESVLKQDWSNWELLVVNNASIDATGSIAMSYKDPRIQVLDEPVIGISSARNRALASFRGDFFTFLDADDRLPVNSIRLRAEMLRNRPELEFVDGRIEYWNKDFSRIIRIAHPTFRGVPYMEVASLNESCLCAFSWMFRKVTGKPYVFSQHWSHSEDIAFLLSISRDGFYDFVDGTTLQVRRGHPSTMTNLRGLENGYHQLLDHVEALHGIDADHTLALRRKVRRIMFRTYLKKLQFSRAVLAWIKFSEKI